MPIAIPNDLPAAEILQNENIFVMKQLHGGADTLVALFFGKISGYAGIDAAAHCNYRLFQNFSSFFIIR